MQNFVVYRLFCSIEFILITRNYKLRTRKNIFNTFIYLENINSCKLQKKIVVFLFLFINLIEFLAKLLNIIDLILKTSWNTSYII